MEVIQSPVRTHARAGRKRGTRIRDDARAKTGEAPSKRPPASLLGTPAGVPVPKGRAWDVSWVDVQRWGERH